MKWFIWVIFALIVVAIVGIATKEDKMADWVGLGILLVVNGGSFMWLITTDDDDNKYA